jgi:hypothetical protein
MLWPISGGFPASFGRIRVHPAGLVSDLGRFPFLKAGLIDSASAWRPIETQYLFVAEIPVDRGWAIISTLISLFHHVIRSALLNLRKYLIINALYNLEARGVEPLFPPSMSGDDHGCFIRAILEANTFQ